MAYIWSDKSHKSIHYATAHYMSYTKSTGLYIHSTVPFAIIHNMISIKIKYCTTAISISTGTHWFKSVTYFIFILKNFFIWLYNQIPIIHIGRVTEVELSCCLDVLSTDGKTGWQDGRAYATWLICNIWILGYLLPLNEYPSIYKKCTY